MPAMRALVVRTSDSRCGPAVSVPHGHKEVVVPSFVHYLEVLEGEDGAKAGGDWPAFHKSTAHASPLLRESGEGTEILLPMYDGEVHFFNDRGETAETANPN